MQSEWLTLVLAAIALVGPLLTYQLAKRSQSGTIETSDARSLWGENAGLRAMLSDQITRLSGEIDRLSQENERLGQENRSLNEQVKQLTVEVQDLREQIAGRA